MSETILKADSITKSYASHLALQDVSFDIPKGAIFGMLGPNGAGKTTMIRIINQIIAPDSGTLTFNGSPLEPKHIEQIGYLPEERGLYRKMKVGEQAMYLARLKGMKSSEAKKKLNAWFEKFEMTAWWNKKVEELSKGMQQKVQFVATVIHEPQLLILDEPFTGFDPINTEIVKEEIQRLKSNGTTIVISTHRMESVEELCDHIALINTSKIVLSGSVKEIRKQHKTSVYEMRIDDGQGRLPGLLSGNYELIESQQDDEEVLYRVKLISGTANDLVSLACQVGELHYFKEMIPSMNEIFIQTVQKN